MLPPTLESIAHRTRRAFLAVVSQDTAAEVLPDLLTATEQITALVQELGLGMLQDYADTRTAQGMAHRERCSCGRLKESLKKKAWTHSTLFGDVRVVDPYTYCRFCRDSERPVEAWLGTDREPWSLLAQEAAVDLATDESCQKAVAKLARHHPGVEMGRTTALHLLHQHGAQARMFIDEKIGGAVGRYVEQGRAPGEPAEEMEVQFDGGMVPVATLEPIEPPEGEEPERTPVRGLLKRRKNARWEEVKAGLVQVPGELERLYCLRPTTGLDDSFADLFGLACMKGWTETTQTRGLADGALHIRPRMEEAFDLGQFRFILDRPHCKEHLSSAGKGLEEMTAEPAQDWATAALAKLEVGRADEVVAEVLAAYEASGESVEDRNDTLRREAGYFERNRDAVEYALYREHGWSTASSEIESAHGHVVQARLKIAGAWWHPDNVDNLLALRMLKANGWWDEYWARQRQEWRQRAEQFTRTRPEVAT